MTNRRQHVVPYFYLKEFFPGFVYRKGQSTPRFTRKARNISVRTDYYGKPQEEPLLPLDKFNSVIENETAPIFQKLKNDVTAVTKGDWITLSYFFANMQIRNPAYIEMYRTTIRHMTRQVIDMTDNMRKSYESAKAEGKEFPIPEIPPTGGERRYSIDELKGSLEELDAPRGHIRIAEGLYFQIRDIASYIQNMSLHVFKASGGHFFVSTDTPLMLYGLSTGTPAGAGWANRDAMAMLPMDPKYCLMLAYRAHPAIYTGQLIDNDVNLWNVHLMKYASSEVYSKYPYDLASDWICQRGIWQTS